MSNIVFNVALGMVGYYTGLPGSTDQLVLVALELTGLADDSTMRDYDTLADVLAGASNEQTTVGRKVLAGNSTAVNDTTNLRLSDFTDDSFLSAGGNAIGALLVCYKPASGSPDSDIVPLTKHDFVVTPNGGDIGVVVAATGFHSTSSVA